MRRKIGTKVTLLVSLFIFAITLSHGEEWKTYESPVGYSIDYPSDWQASSDLFGLFVNIRRPQTLGTVSLGFIPLSHEYILVNFESLDDFVEKLHLREFKKSFNPILLEKGKITIDDREVSFFVYTSTMTGLKDGKKLKSKKYAFVKDSIIYYLGYRATEENFNKYLPIFETIVRSVKPSARIDRLKDSAFKVLNEWVSSSFLEEDDPRLLQMRQNWQKEFLEFSVEDIKNREPGIEGVIEAGQLLQLYGEHEQAIKHFQEAVKMEPNTPQAAYVYMYLGGSYFELKQHEMAEENFIIAKKLFKKMEEDGTPMSQYIKNYLEKYLQDTLDS